MSTSGTSLIPQQESPPSAPTYFGWKAPDGPPPSRPRPPSGMRAWAWVLVVLVVSAAVGAGAYFGGRAAGMTGGSASTTVAGISANSTEPVADVAARLMPSVVELETSSGLGAGFVYDSRGLILTAAHVVSGFSQVSVRFSDGTVVTGRVVGADTNSDVAVVQVDRPGLVAAPLGTNVTLRVGQLAIAVGSPFGLADSVTSGVISATDRAITGSDNVTRNLIQTDTPLNPGNSGGPLADRAGQVIGINDAIFTKSGGNEGLGFAIPIGTAVHVATELVAGRVPQAPVLGVSATATGAGQPAGALVSAVVAGSPAAAAGIQVGDIITAVNGQAVTDGATLAAAIHGMSPGDQVSLTVVRNGQQLTITVTLGGS